MPDLAAAVLAGDRLALSRLLTQVENDTPEGRAALSELFPHTGQAHLIGVTGATGTGKSSLVTRLACHYRNPPDGPARRVAVVAVDPSSPFTGGAILGDRIRMRALAGDPGVFIRSMASRGVLGGLAVTTAGLVQVFDACGYEIVFIETVGAGQVEVEVARLAHTTLVVEAPGLGDDVQAIKAGILEIADLVAVNKADRPGANQAASALRYALKLAHPVARDFPPVGKAGHRPASRPDDGRTKEDQAQAPLWEPPVLLTVATEGEGIPKLADAIAAHRRFLQESGEWERRDRDRLRAELDAILRETLVARWRAAVPEAEYQAALDRLAARRISPRQAAGRLLGEESQ